MPDDPQAALAAAETAPSEDAPVEVPATPTEITKEERDRRAAEGRARSRDLERRALTAEQQVQELRQQQAATAQQVRALSGAWTQQQQAAWEARVAALPPDQQAVEIAKMAYQQSLRAQAPAPTPQAPAPRETPEQYAERRATQLLAKANGRHRLTGDAALTVPALEAYAAEHDEDPWVDEDQFYTLALEAAQARASRRSPPEESAVAKSEDKAFEARVAKEVEKRVRDQTGAHRSLSAEAAPSVEYADADIRAQFNPLDFDNRRGRAGRLKDLDETRQAIRARVRKAVSG